MIENIWNNTDLQQLREEYVNYLRLNFSDKFSQKDRKFLENIILNYNKYCKEDAIRAIILYSIFDSSKAIRFSREKGVFRYKSFGEQKNNALFFINELIERSEILNLSFDDVKYLSQKEQCKWMLKYYSETESILINKIKSHQGKRYHFEKDGVILETALFLELLSYIELIFRDGTITGRKASKVINMDSLEQYSQEEISDAISYLMYLYTDKIGIDFNKSYWLDTEFVFSKDLREMILYACKINTLTEWELLVDHYGYQIKKHFGKWHIVGDDNDLEKSIRLGFIKRTNQEISFVNTQNHKNDDCSLHILAQKILDEFESEIVELKHAEKMTRYVFKLNEKILKIVAPSDFKNIKFYTEEIDTINYMAKELLITSEEMISKRITEHCTMTDILLFKRFFVLLTFVQKHVFAKESNQHYIAASITPVFWEQDLLPLLDIFTGDRTKTMELLNLFTWNQKNKLDMQYTPIFKVGKRYYFSIATLTMSNLCRNAIANSYLLKNQIVNSDGNNDPLIKKCEEAFYKCKEDYHINKNLNFVYKNKSGEIDFIVCTNEEIFIFECKAPLMPTNNFEMRATYDYINKANMQLNLCVEAFNDEQFREKYFKQWGIDNSNSYKIYTCILLGNRLFTGYKGVQHPIRCIQELNMILTFGEIRSKVSTWSYWENKIYSNKELIKFLSLSEPLTKSFLDAMISYRECLSCGRKKVVFNSYYYSVYNNIKNNDKLFYLLNKDNQLRKKLDLQYGNAICKVKCLMEILIKI